MILTPEGFRPRIADAVNATSGSDAAGCDFVVHGGKLLVTRGDNPTLVATSNPVLDGVTPAATHYFGDYCGKACRVVVLENNAAIGDAHEAFEWKGLRALFGVLPDEETGIAVRAMQLAEWTRTHRHCGACGTLMQKQPGERAMHCPSCGFTAYPRIAPAMMVLVRNGPKVLLGRAPNFVNGVYSALAGFVEAGESVEECVHREVAEEVGIRIDNLRYFRSQSWPFPNSLMLAFVADYAGGDVTPDPAELVDARWFGIDELPKLPMRFSISRALIDSVVADITAGR